MRHGIGRLRTSGSGFTPASLFAAGERGAWYAPSDLASMFQDSAGTTPVTAVNQPVGKLSDESGNGNHATQATAGNRPFLRGTPTGPELVTNGGFADGTGWTPGSGWAIGSGVATATTASAALSQAGLPGVNAKWYQLIFTITASAGSIQPQIGGATGISRTTAGTYTDWIQATGTGALQFNTTGFSGTLDNVSVKSADAADCALPYFLGFNGSTHSLSTAAINLTNTSKINLAVGVKQDSFSTGVVCETSANAGGNAGALLVYFASGSLNCSISGVGAVLASLQDGAVPTVSLANPFTYNFQLDLTGGTAAAQLGLWADGATILPATLTGPAGAGPFGNFALFLGQRGGSSLPFSGRLYSFILRGAASNESVMLATENYVNSATGAYTPTPSVFAIGDSTIAAYVGQQDVLNFVSSHYTKRTVAIPGNTIAQQRTAWIATTGRDNPRWVAIQVGLNDLDPAEAASVAIARLQTLVNTVASMVRSFTRIYICQLTPCRADLITLYGGVNGPVAYQKWLDMNTAIGGGGGTPITGITGRVSSHVALLNDGSGNLAAVYDTGDGIHENDAGRQIVATAWSSIIGADL